MAGKSLLRYLARRTAFWLLSILGAFTFTFFIFHLIPGDPVTAFIGALAAKPGGAIAASAVGTEGTVQAYIRMFGLDRPLPEQLFIYFRNLILHGDMGLSLMVFPDHAQKPIMEALPWTVGLLGLATIISWTLGVIIGGYLGWKRDSPVSKALFVFSLGLQQIPNYLMALTLLLSLAYGLKWFPTRGAHTPLQQPSLSLPFIWDVVRHGALPALSVVVVSLAGWAISSRALIISILGEDYLVFAEAKGLPKSRVFYSYALRNALLPQVTSLGMSLGFIVNGAFLVEWFFTYPGIGWTFVRAISYLDFNVILGIVLISITAVLSANLVIDLVLPLIDPRIQLVASTRGQ